VDGHSSRRCILPPNLLAQLARSDEEGVRGAALDALHRDARFRIARAETAGRRGGPAAQLITFARVGGTPGRIIHDQKHDTSQTPGPVVRAEGQGPVQDEAVNHAYEGLGATYQYYWQSFQRDSIDRQGLELHGCVYYGTGYPNAFWDGRAMFFGDGDGQMLTETTSGIDVIGHELTHGVTQHEANLVYSGQSGALNESISDVFGIQIKQKVLEQDTASSDWLIGADIVGPTLRPALRSMKAPGTANPYDEQPTDMDGYVVDGDVHTNSGIPNRAFYVLAETLGGHAWDAAGPIWYRTLCDRQLSPAATFAQFARLTVVNAGRLYGSQSREVDAVRSSWNAVKVSF
jgi:Zn-dependent metalloprotease